MVRCINCSVAIPVTQQYQYNAIYMGPDILSVLEEWIDRQVIDEDVLCQECVNLLIVEANNRNEGNIGKQQYGYQSVCIGCGTSIARKSASHTRVILINQGDPVWNYFADTIGHTEIPSNARVCRPCWLKAHRQRPTERSQTPLNDHLGTASNKIEDTEELAPVISAASPSYDGRDTDNGRKSRIRNGHIVKSRNKDLNDSENCDYPESVNLKVCRICLAMDKKLYPIRKYKLDKAYENLTGLRVSEEDKLPQKLCYECVQRLINCSRFRTKSLRAMTLMMQIVKNQDHLTIRSLKSLSSMNKQFAPPLATRNFAPNHYDYLLEDSSKKNDSVKKNNIDFLEKIDSVTDTDRSKNNDAVQKNNIEFVEEFDSVIDTEDNLNGSMDSSDENGSLGVDKRKKMAKENPKRVRKKLSKGANSETVKCLKTFVDHTEYERHLASREELTVPNTLLPIYRKTDNGFSDAEIIIDTEIENNNIDTNSKVKDALDVKDEDPLTKEHLELEIDYTTDDSTVPEVKKKKKETKEVRKRAQKDTLNKECLETVIDYTTDDSEVLELKKRKRETKEVTKRTQKDTETKDEDPLKEEYLESQIDYSTVDSTVQEVKKRKKETKEVRTRTKTEPKRNIGGKMIVTLNKMIFDVTELTFEEQVAEIEKRKESSNYKNAVFRCEECYKGYLDEEVYDSHMLKHTNECGEHRCAVCNSYFKRAFQLRKHATDHHTYRFSCKQCPYVTAYKHSACRHERWHEGTKYSCPHCPGEFLKFSTYLGHIRIKHPSDFVCQLCGFSFVSEKGKHQHLKLKHRMESALIPPDGPLCELCDIRFISSQALNQHISVSAKHHSGDKAALKPNQPKYRTKTKDSIKRAIDRFGKEYEIRNGVIPCEQCGVQLEGSLAYHSHFRRMHPGETRTNYPSMRSPRMCEVCGRIFQNKTQLEDHRGSHTGEQQFKCELCGQSFSMKQRLLGHFRRRHSDNNATYPCPTCGKHFSSSCNRTRHMVIHTGLKPFKCEMCGKAFKLKDEKRSHISYVHLKKPWPKRNRKRDRKVPTKPSSCTPTTGMSV